MLKVLLEMALISTSVFLGLMGELWEPRLLKQDTALLPKLDRAIGDK